MLFHPVEVRVRINCFLSARNGVKLNEGKNDSSVFCLKVNVNNGSKVLKLFSQVTLICLNHQKGPTSMLKLEI